MRWGAKTCVVADARDGARDPRRSGTGTRVLIDRALGLEAASALLRDATNVRERASCWSRRPSVTSLRR